MHLISSLKKIYWPTLGLFFLPDNIDLNAVWKLRLEDCLAVTLEQFYFLPAKFSANRLNCIFFTTKNKGAADDLIWNAVHLTLLLMAFSLFY